MQRFKLGIAATIIAVLAGLMVSMIPAGESPTADAMTPRLRDYRVTALGLLMEVISQGTNILASNVPVPGNVTVVSQAVQPDGSILVRLYDPSFDLVPDGELPPVVNWEWYGYAPGSSQYQASYLRGNPSALPLTPDEIRVCFDVTQKYFQSRALTTAEVGQLMRCWGVTRVPGPIRISPYTSPVLPMPTMTPRSGDPVKR